MFDMFLKEPPNLIFLLNLILWLLYFVAGVFIAIVAVAVFMFGFAAIRGLTLGYYDASAARQKQKQLEQEQLRKSRDGNSDNGV